MRAALNRVLALVIVPAALAHIVIVSHVRPASARAVAGRWIRLLARATGVRIEVRGRTRLAHRGLTVLVANHSSFLDVVALLVAEPTVTFVAGADLFRIPLLAGAMRALGTVPVDRRSGGAHLQLPAGHRARTLAVFPEGGIPPAGYRRPFKRGAFVLAIQHGADLVPVAIHGTAAVMPPSGKFAIRPGTVTVEYLPGISTRGLDVTDRHGMAARAEKALRRALGPADGGIGRPQMISAIGAGAG